MADYDPDTKLEERDPELRYKRNKLINAIEKFDSMYDQTLKVINQNFERIQNQTDVVRNCFDALEREIPLAIQRDIRRLQATVNRQDREIKRLEKELKDAPKVRPGPEPSVIESQKASTICIFDTILFAIENWSTDGQTAPDVSLCSQSILFPLVYEQVMKGNEDYYLDKFPSISMEVVRRGRTFVKWLREESPAALTSPEVWEVYASEVQSWWINDGLPLLYGARDDDWSIEGTYTFNEMVKWRDMPASRVLDFPLIHDGMDLVSKYMDSIKEPIGLRSFNQQQVQTRFNHE